MTETRGERKLVTLLFSDLTGYTALAASLDPEEVFSFIQPTMVELQRVVEDHGGTVPQVQGDGFMAIFGVPAAHEDDAERAVRAALAVRDRVRELNEGRSGLAIPEVHSGVNSGEVMVGPAPEASGIAVVGDVVNTASRLADLAPPGAVLVEEQSWRRTRHAIRYGPRRSYAAKGKPRPVAAYEARTPRTPFPAGRATPSLGAEFVDREGPLERLSAELRAVRRIAERGSRPSARNREPARPDWRPNSPGGIPTCCPRGASDRLRREHGVVTPGRRRRRDRRGRTGVDSRRPADPCPREAGGDRGRCPARDTRAVDAPRCQRSLREPRSRGTEDAIAAARTVLEGLARERTVVVVLDDLHWGRSGGRQRTRGGRHRPLGRTDPVHGPHAVRFPPRPRRRDEIELDAIPDDAMGELASLALGRKSFTSALRRIVTRAGGNPLFLEESLSMLVDAGALVSTASGWSVIDPEMLDRVPTTVRAMIAARLDGLPPAEKRVLQCASVTGELPGPAPRTADPGGRRPDGGAKPRRPGPPPAAPSAARHELERVRLQACPDPRRRLRFPASRGTGPPPCRGRRLALARRQYAAREPVDDLAHHYAEAWRLSGSMTATKVPDGLARAVLAVSRTMGRRDARVPGPGGRVALRTGDRGGHRGSRRCRAGAAGPPRDRTRRVS